VGIVVVRYFGGTLLGVPGLINAYKTASALALQTTPLIQRPVLVHYRLQFDYTMMNPVMTIIKQCGSVITRQEMQLFCLLEISVPENRREEILYRLKELYTVEIQKI